MADGIPNARDVMAGRTAADDALEASFEEVAQAHAEVLIPSINCGLETIQAGGYGEVTKGKLRDWHGDKVSYVVSVASTFVMVDLYGYHGGQRLVNHLSVVYAPYGYKVSGKETDPGYHYYRVFVAAE